MHTINSLTILHFLNHVIVLPELSLVERRRAKDRERLSKRYLNMTDDQKAKKNATSDQLGLSVILILWPMLQPTKVCTFLQASLFLLQHIWFIS